jgi:glycerol kinase
MADFSSIYPSPGGWNTTPWTYLNLRWKRQRRALKRLNKGRDIAAAELQTSAKHTTVWGTAYRNPYYNAIVWRAQNCGLCEEQGRKLKTEIITRRQALFSTLFSATKISGYWKMSRE